MPVGSLYTAYIEYCSQHREILPATKQCMAKVVHKIFPNVILKRNKVKGKQENVYLNLRFKSTDSRPICNGIENIQLPESWTLETNGTHHVMVIPTEWIKNGDPITKILKVPIGGDTFTLTVDEKEVNLYQSGLSNHFTWTNSFFKSLENVLSSVTLCTGHVVSKYNHVPDKGYICSVWNNLFTHDTLSNVCSNKCDHILSPMSVGGACRKCVKYLSELNKQNCKISTTVTPDAITEIPANGENEYCPPNVSEYINLTDNINNNNGMSNSNESHDEIDDNDLNEIADTDLNEIADNNSNKIADNNPNEIDDSHNDDNELSEMPINEEMHTDLMDIIDKIMPSCTAEFKILLQSQIKNCNDQKDPRFRRWSPSMISLCLSVYARSPKVYKDLKDSKALVLPSGRLLQYYKNTVKHEPGFVDDNLLWMKREADRQNIPQSGRRGGLQIDEMQIQDDLQVRIITLFVMFTYSCHFA